MIEKPAVVAFAPPETEIDDLQRLAGYLGGPFVERVEALAQAQSAPLAYKFDCAELIRKANLFQLELVGWLGLAKRLYAEEYARALSVTRSVETQKLAGRDRTVRPTAGMIEADAEETVAPLIDAITRIEQTMRFCERLTSAAQTQLRVMSDDEFSGRAEGDASGSTDGWDDFQHAPVASALERLGRR